jgi:hypothetical protein
LLLIFDINVKIKLIDIDIGIDILELETGNPLLVLKLPVAGRGLPKKKPKCERESDREL